MARRISQYGALNGFQDLDEESSLLSLGLTKAFPFIAKRLEVELRSTTTTSPRRTLFVALLA